MFHSTPFPIPCKLALPLHRKLVLHPLYLFYCNHHFYDIFCTVSLNLATPLFKHVKRFIVCEIKNQHHHWYDPNNQHHNPWVYDRPLHPFQLNFKVKPQLIYRQDSFVKNWMVSSSRVVHEIERCKADHELFPQQPLEPWYDVIMIIFGLSKGVFIFFYF